jgi:hypothetical protein
MMKINITDSIATLQIDDMEDDVVYDMDDNVDMSAGVVNDMAADMATM